MSVGYLKKCSTRGRPKVTHPSRAAAEAFRRNMVRLGKWSMAATNTYWCGECGGGYHAGHLGRANRGKSRKTAVKNRRKHFDTQ